MEKRVAELAGRLIAEHHLEKKSTPFSDQPGGNVGADLLSAVSNPSDSSGGAAACHHGVAQQIRTLRQ